MEQQEITTPPWSRRQVRRRHRRLARRAGEELGRAEGAVKGTIRPSRSRCVRRIARTGRRPWLERALAGDGRRARRPSSRHGDERSSGRRAGARSSARPSRREMDGRAVEQGPGRDASSEFRTRVLDFILELSGGWSWNTGEPGAALERSEQGTTG